MIVRRVAAAAVVLSFTLADRGELRAQSRAAFAGSEWMPDHTALTVAPDGAWGAATDAYLNRAVADAIANCKAMSSAKLGCGAYLATVRAGWSLGLRCGDTHVIVVAEPDLADAERMAQRREDDLRINYAPGMPPCTRVVTVDPSGRINAPKGDGLSGRVSTR